MEKDLIQAALAGDKKAEEDLFTKLNARFLGLVKLILRNQYPAVINTFSEMDFEDVVQDALLIVKQKYRNVGIEDRFFPWCNGVLTNVMKNKVQKTIRTSKRVAVLSTDDYDFVDDEVMEDTIADHDFLHKIEIAIQSMDATCKQILMIFFKNGVREDVIKLFPDKPIGTIDNLIFRCRQKLRKKLQAGGCII